MKKSSEMFVASVAFVVALGGTLVALPVILENTAFAASGPGDGRDGEFPMPSARIEPRLAYIKTALKITDAQTAQWNAVADVMRKHAKDADSAVAAMRAERDEKHTLIDGIEHHQKMLTKEAAYLGELLAAARPLYASLSQEQKTSADELLVPHMGGRPWFHHGMGPGMPGPGGPEGIEPGPHP